MLPRPNLRSNIPSLFDGILRYLFTDQRGAPPPWSPSASTPFATGPFAPADGTFAPRLADYVRRGGQIGVRIALALEAVALIVLTVLNLAVAALGVLDGVDELFALLAIVVGALLAFTGWILGALGGALVYANARQRRSAPD